MIESTAAANESAALTPVVEHFAEAVGIPEAASQLAGAFKDFKTLVGKVTPGAAGVALFAAALSIGALAYFSLIRGRNDWPRSG